MVATGTPNDLKWQIRQEVIPGTWKFLDICLQGANKNIHIMDVGCSNGNLLLGCVKKGYKNITGIEYVKVMFQKTLQLYPKLKIF